MTTTILDSLPPARHDVITMRSHMPWTLEEDVYLLCSLGLASYKRIGEGLERSGEAVRSRYYHLFPGGRVLGRSRKGRCQANEENVFELRFGATKHERMDFETARVLCALVLSECPYASSAQGRWEGSWFVSVYYKPRGKGGVKPIDEALLTPAEWLAVRQRIREAHAA